MDMNKDNLQSPDTPEDLTLSPNADTPEDLALSPNADTPEDPALSPNADSPEDPALSPNADTPEDLALSPNADTPEDLALSPNADSPESTQDAQEESELAFQQWLDELLASVETDNTATADAQPATHAEPVADEAANQALLFAETQTEAPSLAEADALLDSLLLPPEQSNELGADEQAVYLAGLTNIEDAELEKILAENWAQSEETDDATETDAQQSISTEDATEDAVDPQPEADDTLAAPSPRKIRPKAKKGYGLLGIPHILATAVWLAVILAAGLSLGRLLWVCCADVMAFGKTPQKVTITITENDTIETIAKKLGQANLVRYPKLFQFFAEITGKDDNISVGTFKLNSQLDYNAMINAMVYYGATREVVDVMFSEGANCAQIFKSLEEHKVCTVEELEEYAANGELSDYWFLEGVERGDKYCLEGYLAPDTYKFYTNDEPRRVLEKFLDEFESRFTEKMKDELAAIQKSFAETLAAKGMDPDYIAAHPLNLHQIVTLASIVQRETSSDGECYEIASVFYNRLTNPNYLYLGSDATVYYAIGDYFREVEELTEEHLNTDSPYNTRKSKGIPPGPICNMGVFALYSVLEPNESNYYYFLYDANNKKHIFSSTYQEHMQNIEKLEG